MFPFAGRETVPTQWKVGEMSEFSGGRHRAEKSILTHWIKTALSSPLQSFKALKKTKIVK